MRALHSSTSPNSAGDSIHVIDTATDKVVQVIDGIEAAHGINFAADRSNVYVSNESTDTLDVFDRETGKLVKQIELSARPSNIAVSKDGARIFVAIRRDPGAVDVIDAATLGKLWHSGSSVKPHRRSESRSMSDVGVRSLERQRISQSTDRTRP
jgi:DNA-binding beta-propeller fold protein YncE